MFPPAQLTWMYVRIFAWINTATSEDQREKERKREEETERGQADKGGALSLVKDLGRIPWVSLGGRTFSPRKPKLQVTAVLRVPIPDRCRNRRCRVQIIAEYKKRSSFLLSFSSFFPHSVFLVHVFLIIAFSTASFNTTTKELSKVHPKRPPFAIVSFQKLTAAVLSPI